MVGVGRGAGKLILFGEHAVVHGYPALGLPLPLHVTTTLRPIDQDTWILPKELKNHTAAIHKLITFFRAAFPSLSNIGACRLSVTSEIPIGSGMGSSAALCVSFLRAVMDLCSQHKGILQRSAKKQWAIAHEAEKIFHGTPSGIDTGLALLPGLRYFKGRPGELPYHRSMPSHKFSIIVGAVPRSGNTKDLVAHIRRQLHDNNPATQHHIKQLGLLATRASQLFKTHHPLQEIGHLANTAHKHLQALELSTPMMDHLLDAGRQAGALGGKLSGAGGGGAFYLMTKTGRSSHRVYDQLTSILKKTKTQTLALESFSIY